MEPWGRWIGVWISCVYLQRLYLYLRQHHHKQTASLYNGHHKEYLNSYWLLQRYCFLSLCTFYCFVFNVWHLSNFHYNFVLWFSYGLIILFYSLRITLINLSLDIFAFLYFDTNQLLWSELCKNILCKYLWYHNLTLYLLYTK